MTDQGSHTYTCSKFEKKKRFEKRKWWKINKPHSIEEFESYSQDVKTWQSEKSAEFGRGSLFVHHKRIFWITFPWRKKNHNMKSSISKLNLIKWIAETKSSEISLSTNFKSTTVSVDQHQQYQHINTINTSTQSTHINTINRSTRQNINTSKYQHNQRVKNHYINTASSTSQNIYFFPGKTVPKIFL